jgi:hypothetical protein
MPRPEHQVFDQRLLNGLGQASFLHRLSINMPKTFFQFKGGLPLEYMHQARTWVELTEETGLLQLAVVAHSSDHAWSRDLKGDMHGELAEVWVKITN